jgi:alkaline phosphatase D
MHDRRLERLLGTRISRRTIILTAGALAGLAAARPLVPSALPRPSFSADPFSLGVASGDPLPDGVVLWTRLAPDPLNGGGMPPENVEVQWELATDDRMRNIVQRGSSVAIPTAAHSVHVEVEGLQPERHYWYRFRAGSAESAIGRTRTAPAGGSSPSALRFAFTSCQNWHQGHYGAYRDLASQDLDLVLHLGDYIYESTIPENGGVRGVALPAAARVEPTTLDEYRLRYAVYKTDPRLQAAHASAPWIVTWDDHEVENDYAGQASRRVADPQRFLLRRAAAYQAYYEHQPLRRAALPAGPNALLYRHLGFGGLIDLHVLDTRQYRSPQIANPNCADAERAQNGGYCAASLDASRTMLGAEQKHWLLDGLDRSTAAWTVLAQQVPFAQRDLSNDSKVKRVGGEGDKWDGYAHERNEVLQAMSEIAARRAFSPVILTGDVHTNLVFDLKMRWDDPGRGTTIGTELVGTSISSNGDAPLTRGGFTSWCGGSAQNPHNLFQDDHRGYVLCTVTPERWQADFRIMANVRGPDAPASTLASFVVERGRPGAQLASACPSRP